MCRVFLNPHCVYLEQNILGQEKSDSDNLACANLTKETAAVYPVPNIVELDSLDQAIAEP